MGDAYLPFADDGGAGLFYNPARLAAIQHKSLEMFNFTLSPNSYFAQSFDANTRKIYSLKQYAPTLHGDEFPGFGITWLPSFQARGFGAGILIQNRVQAHSANGETRYRSLYEITPAVGFGLRLASGIIKLGYSAQWVNQAYGDVTVPSNDKDLGYNQQLYQGTAFSHTVGASITLPVTYLPSLNVVARNVGSARYNGNGIMKFGQNPKGVPPTEPMTLDASLSMQPKLGGGSIFNMVFELRDMSSQSKFSILKRAAIGMELSIKQAFMLRGGFGDGFPCAGVGVRTKRSEFSLTYASEEIGTPAHKEMNTSYMVQYQIRAF